VSAEIISCQRRQTFQAWVAELAECNKHENLEKKRCQAIITMRRRATAAVGGDGDGGGGGGGGNDPWLRPASATKYHSFPITGFKVIALYSGKT
jgi:hypothetical protein